MAVLVGENTVNTGFLQLAVLKRLAVLKGPIFNIFFLYSFSCVFCMFVCVFCMFV